MPKVNVGDINMYYEVHGEGEPLLLITGLGRDLTIWILQTREFSKKYQLMVFDNRGVGRTDAPDVPYSFLFTDKFFENPEMVQMTVNNMMVNPYQSPADAFARQFFAGRGYDMRERLGQITAPTLVIVGKEDILLPVKLSKELAEGIPNAELVILEEGGHGFFIEIADKFNKAVLEFLAKVESRFFKV